MKEFFESQEGGSGPSTSDTSEDEVGSSEGSPLQEEEAEGAGEGILREEYHNASLADGEDSGSGGDNQTEASVILSEKGTSVVQEKNCNH